MTATSSNKRVAVCVTTYNRPVGLARLLDGIAELEFIAKPPDVTVVVIDNDENRSAEPVVDRISDGYRWPLRYEHEPQRGITYGRNRALMIAQPLADFIAFVDDDEKPRADWLDRLIQTQQRTGADVVTGPVVPHSTNLRLTGSSVVDFFSDLAEELALLSDMLLPAMCCYGQICSNHWGRGLIIDVR